MPCADVLRACLGKLEECVLLRRGGDVHVEIDAAVFLPVAPVEHRQRPGLEVVRHVERELERLAEPHRSSYLNLIKDLPRVEISDEAAILAEGYISRGIFHRKYISDAMHVALASLHKFDLFVTWDFGHIANVHRQARLKLFNTAAGFFVPEIVTPEFLVS